MSRRITGIERERPLVFLFGGGPAPIVEIQDEGQRGVGFAQVIVQGQRRGRGRLGSGKSILWRQDPVFPVSR